MNSSLPPSPTKSRQANTSFSTIQPMQNPQQRDLLSRAGINGNNIGRRSPAKIKREVVTFVKQATGQVNFGNNLTHLKCESHSQGTLGNQFHVGVELGACTKPAKSNDQQHQQTKPKLNWTHPRLDSGINNTHLEVNTWKTGKNSYNEGNLEAGKTGILRRQQPQRNISYPLLVQNNAHQVHVLKNHLLFTLNNTSPVQQTPHYQTKLVPVQHIMSAFNYGKLQNKRIQLPIRKISYRFHHGLSVSPDPPSPWGQGGTWPYLTPENIVKL